MNAKSLHPARGTRPGPALEHITEPQKPLPGGQACCCPARPVVRVVMPPTATRRHRTELLLCGHHYRVSAQALAAAGATVIELTEISGDKPVALLPELPAPRAAVR